MAPHKIFGRVPPEWVPLHNTKSKFQKSHTSVKCNIKPNPKLKFGHFIIIIKKDHLERESTQAQDNPKKGIERGNSF
jgi:hypothetical protein